MRGILRFGELYENILCDNRSSLQHVVVPVPDYSKALSLQDGIPHWISLRRSVLAAVDLDDEAPFETNEVKDEILKGHLTTKFE